MIVFSERSLHHHLHSFVGYYHQTRTAKDSPEPRGVQTPDAGRIISIPEVGGLHHRYERRAARTGASANHAGMSIVAPRMINVDYLWHQASQPTMPQ